MKIIAHRGYYQGANGAENSIQALEAAYKLGIDGVEVDVRATKDDSLVLVHNEAYGGMSVAEKTYDELARKHLANGERLPVLRSYFEKMKGYNSSFILILDIKTKRAEELTASLYKSMNMGINVYLPYSITQYMEGWDNLSLQSDYMDPVEAKKKGIKMLGVDRTRGDADQMIAKAKESGLSSNIFVIETESDLIKAYSHHPSYITTNIPLEAIQFRNNYE